jgi:hypothetical protein
MCISNYFVRLSVYGKRRFSYLSIIYKQSFCEQKHKGKDADITSHFPCISAENKGNIVPCGEIFIKLKQENIFFENFIRRNKFLIYCYLIIKTIRYQYLSIKRYKVQ